MKRANKKNINNSELHKENHVQKSWTFFILGIFAQFIAFLVMNSISSIISPKLIEAFF